MKHQSASMSYSSPVGDVKYSEPNGSNPMAGAGFTILAVIVIIFLVIAVFFLIALVLRWTYNGCMPQLFGSNPEEDYTVFIYFALFVMFIGFLFTPTTGVFGGMARK